MRDPVCQPEQVRKITAPPITIGSQTVQANRDAGSLASISHDLRFPGAIRAEDQSSFGFGLVLITNSQGVIAEARAGRQRQQPAYEAPPPHGCGAFGLKRRDRGHYSLDRS